MVRKSFKPSRSLIQYVNKKYLVCKVEQMGEIPSLIQCELKCLKINEVQSWELELRNQAEIDKLSKNQTIHESKTKVING